MRRSASALCVKTTIKLSMEDGSRAWAYPVFVKGGLALHKTPRSLLGAGWTITHIGSGLALAQRIRTRALAESALRRFLRLGDWTRPAAKMSADKTLCRAARKIRQAVQPAGRG